MIKPRSVVDTEEIADKREYNGGMFIYLCFKQAKWTVDRVHCGKTLDEGTTLSCAVIPCISTGCVCSLNHTQNKPLRKFALETRSVLSSLWTRRIVYPSAFQGYHMNHILVV